MWNGHRFRTLLPFARALFIVWSIGCLILRGSYQGALFEFFQRAIQDTSLDTVQKVLDSSCDLRALEGQGPQFVPDFNFLNFDRKRFVLSDIISKKQLTLSLVCARLIESNATSDDVLDHLRKKQIRGAIFAAESAVNYFNLRRFRGGLVRTTKDRLILAPLVIYFHQHTPLYYLNRIDEEITSYREHGLIDNWVSKYHDRRFVTVAEDKTPKAIQIQSFYGIMIVCLTLLMMSVFVFLLELFSPRNLYIRCIVEFLTY